MQLPLVASIFDGPLRTFNQQCDFSSTVVEKKDLDPRPDPSVRIRIQWSGQDNVDWRANSKIGIYIFYNQRTNSEIRILENQEKNHRK